MFFSKEIRGSSCYPHVAYQTVIKDPGIAVLTSAGGGLSAPGAVLLTAPSLRPNEPEAPETAEPDDRPICKVLTMHVAVGRGTEARAPHR